MAKVVIHFDDGSTCSVQLSDTAQEDIRFNFNPSGLPEVHVLKALAAAFISAYESYTAKISAYESYTAKTCMISAAMWGVLGATKHE